MVVGMKLEHLINIAKCFSQNADICTYKVCKIWIDWCNKYVIRNHTSCKKRYLI